MSGYHQELNFRMECELAVYNSVGAYMGTHIQRGVPDSAGLFGFHLHSIAHSFLKPALPAKNGISWGDTAMVNVKVKIREYWGEPATYKRIALEASHFVFLGGVDPRKTSTDWFAKIKGYQTWAPNNKLVGPAQEDYLTLFTSLAAYSTVYLHAKVVYDDGSFGEYMLLTANNVLNTVLHFPAGFEQLGLHLKQPAKRALSYTLYASNNADPAALAGRNDERTYLLDYAHYPTARTFLYLNSLGGWETLRCTGSFKENWDEEHETAQRMVPYNQTSQISPFFSFNHSARTSIKGNTGRQLSRTWYRHLKEFTLSREVYEITPAGRVKVILKPGKYQIGEDRNTEMSLDFDYSYAHETHSYTP
ncbi:hypothetical protein D770_20355 [Flammeovirgaceae bacterium 311]|nr:hypothetical protein D770_20355 [Flammeovirgaceae bacterium 311]